jgi:hypothetical protein
LPVKPVEKFWGRVYVAVRQGAKISGVYLAGESPAMEGAPAPPCSESCVSEGKVAADKAVVQLVEVQPR